jgi:hypothetical protein
MGRERRQSATTLLPIEPLKSRKAKTFDYGAYLIALVRDIYFDLFYFGGRGADWQRMLDI